MKVLRPGEVWSEDDLRRYTEEIDIPLTEADWERLETEAEQRGVSVYDLIEQRLNNLGQEPHPELDAEVSAFQQRAASIGKDLQSLQETLRTLHRRDAPRETILAMISFIIEQVQALIPHLHEIKRTAPGCPEILEPATALEDEIAKTMATILETGFVAA